MIQFSKTLWTMIRKIKRKIINHVLKHYGPKVPVFESELNRMSGFHGDHYLMGLMEYFLQNSQAFVETGTYYADTAKYVAYSFPQTPIYSCEPNDERFQAATKRCSEIPTIHIDNCFSPEFLYKLFKKQPNLASERATYFLDAHGFGFTNWPLKDEVKFLTETIKSGYLVIDDFQVPGRPEFGYDVYEGLHCNLEYIKSSIDPSRSYSLVYPKYDYFTSNHHPLRGVGTLVVGIENFALPDHLNKYFSIEEL